MNESKNPARERELDKTTALYNAATDYAAYVNSEKHDFVVNPATFDVMVGSSSGDIRQKGSFQITTAGEWPASELTARAADTVD